MSINVLSVIRAADEAETESIWERYRLLILKIDHTEADAIEIRELAGRLGIQTDRIAQHLAAAQKMRELEPRADDLEQLRSQLETARAGTTEARKRLKIEIEAAEARLKTVIAIASNAETAYRRAQAAQDDIDQLTIEYGYLLYGTPAPFSTAGKASLEADVAELERNLTGPRVFERERAGDIGGIRVDREQLTKLRLQLAQAN